MNAPSFPSKEECELALDVRQCIPAFAGEQVFRPVMDGYLVDSPDGALRSEEEQEDGDSGWSSGRTGAWIGRAIGERYGARPIYRSERYPSDYRDISNLVEARAPLFRATPNVTSKTLARRGFGATSRRYGGGWS